MKIFWKLLPKENDIYAQNWSEKLGLHKSLSAHSYILNKDALTFSKHISKMEIGKWRILEPTIRCYLLKLGDGINHLLIKEIVIIN